MTERAPGFKCAGMPDKQHVIDGATKAGIWIIATGIIIFFLYAGRSILATFALAVFLFLIIEGFATAIDNTSRAFKIWHARGAAILIVMGGFVLFLVMMGNGIAEFGRDAGGV